MEAIERFLQIGDGPSSGYGDGDGEGDGYGSGSCDGYGNGDGSGDGSGYGYSYGEGSGDGNGSGYCDEGGNGDGSGSSYSHGNGDGYGDGLKSYNNQKVYMIDHLQTIITAVKGNVAQGFIINSDLTLSACYIVKGENQFAHGSTLKEANDSLQKKLLEELPVEERIKRFKAEFSDKEKAYPASNLYEWHFFLTGSCEMGRRQFCKDKGIDIEKDAFTVFEFIELTKNSYRGDIIKQLI